MKLSHSLVATSLVAAVWGHSFVSRDVSDSNPKPLKDSTESVYDFSYDGVAGPLMWHSLDADYEICAKGEAQSPIVIDSTIQMSKGGKLNIPSVQKAKFENLGYTVQVTAAGNLTFGAAGGMVYDLLQFHFHTPSEHRLFDEYYPVEVHFVFQHSGTKQIVVIAMFAELSEDGSSDELLRSVLGSVDQIPKYNDTAHIGPLRYDSIVGNFSSHQYYQYRGSLTTPPCAPGVSFLITNATLPLDVATFNMAKKVMKFNSRYTQNKPVDPNLLVLASSALASPQATSTGKI